MENKNARPSRLAIAAGVVLIVIGAANLLNRLIPYEIWIAIWSVIGGVWSVAWPLALVVAGVYLLWAAKTGKLSKSNPIRQSGMLRRSRTDRRILGVCGGLARYFGMDSTIVRVAVVILLFVLTPAVLVAYLLLGALIPSE